MVGPADGRLTDELTLLALQARSGDRIALAAFIRHAQPDVWRFVSHLVGIDDADDITQDTFLRAWQALPAYRGDANARTWLLAIARRTCADAIRRRQRQRRLTLRLTAERPHPPERDRAEHWSLTELVELLDPQRREAFTLTQALGCSYTEAAAICGVPIGTIRSRVARARDDLVRQVRSAESA